MLIRAFCVDDPDIRSDHRMITKFRVSAQLTKKFTPRITSKCNVEAFQNESTKFLYVNRLSEKLKITLTSTDTTDLQWEKIQDCIVKAAEESLGTRTVSINVPKKSTPWLRGGDRLLKKNSTKPNLRMVSIAGIKQHEE